MTSENGGFWSRHGMSEDLQLPRWLGLGRVVCPRALSISAALSGVMLSPSSVSGSSQDGMTAYNTSAVGWTHMAWKSRRASMNSEPSRHRLLAVCVATWEDDPNTRPKGLNASRDSRAVCLRRTTTELSVIERTAVKPRDRALLGLVKIDPWPAVSCSEQGHGVMPPERVADSRVFRQASVPAAPGRSARGCSGSLRPGGRP